MPKTHSEIDESMRAGGRRLSHGAGRNAHRLSTCGQSVGAPISSLESRRLDVSLNRMDSSSQAFHIWREALEHTRSLSPASFEQWFASVQFDGFHDGTVALVARDEFVRDWVKTHFQPTLVKRMRELTGVETPDAVRVEWRISRRASRTSGLPGP